MRAAHACGCCFLLAAVVVPATAVFGGGDGSAVGITAVWQRVPITPAAVANDPQLAGMQCWDLMVTTSGFWRTAGLRAQLPSGQFYNHQFGSTARPSAALIAAYPALAFDSYITAPGDNGAPGPAPSIFGGFPDGQPLSMAGSLVSVAWGQLTNEAPGTYSIARLTFPLGGFPEVLNDDPSPVAVFSNTKQVMPDATAEIPEIPEPRAACAAIIAAGALLVRRRTTGPEGKCAT